MKMFMVWAVVLIMFMTPLVAVAAEYDVPTDRKASIYSRRQTLRTALPDPDKVVCYGYMDQFTVNSDYALSSPRATMPCESS